MKDLLKNKKVLIGAAIALVVIIAVILFFVLRKDNDEDNYKSYATYTESFFIKNNKGKYALFNDKGKQKTKFIFTDASKIVNKTAKVSAENKGYAILDEDGEYVIPFGKYNYISSYDGLYKVRSEKGYELIDSDGKTIIASDSIDVSSYGEEYPFIIAKANKYYTVLSYDGEIITKFKIVKDKKEPSVNHYVDIATVFYNGKNVVFNAKDKKIITEFKNKQHYCINGKTKDGKKLTFNACASWFETVEKEGYLVVSNKKVIDLDGKCKSLKAYDNALICEKDNDKYFLKIDGKKAKLGNKLAYQYAFIDEDNYVIKNSETNKVEFYKNGKKVNSIEGTLNSNGKLEEELYIVNTKEGNAFYNQKGEIEINKTFKYAYDFDKNGLAKVADEYNEYYLINKKGEAISKKYYQIYSADEYYEVSNKDYKKGLLNKKGEEILKTEYSNISVRKIRDNFYVLAQDKDSNYLLYDLEKNKTVVKTKDQITLTDHYIKTTGDKSSYFTYTGKLIYKD